MKNSVIALIAVLVFSYVKKTENKHNIVQPNIEHKDIIENGFNVVKIHDFSNCKVIY